MLTLAERYFEQLAGDKMQEAGHLIDLLVFLYRSKYSNDDTNAKIESLFSKLCRVEAIKQKIEQTHASLPPEAKKKLETCLKMAKPN